jgi:hypothetical protein
VQEAIGVAEELDSGPRDLLEMGERGKVDQQVIGLVRDEYADIDSARSTAVSWRR